MKTGKAIKCCPLCGGRIVVSVLYQCSLDYVMRQDGTIGNGVSAARVALWMQALPPVRTTEPAMPGGKSMTFLLTVIGAFGTINIARRMADALLQH